MNLAAKIRETFGFALMRTQMVIDQNSIFPPTSLQFTLNIVRTYEYESVIDNDTILRRRTPMATNLAKLSRTNHRIIDSSWDINIRTIQSYGSREKSTPVTGKTWPSR